VEEIMKNLFLMTAVAGLSMALAAPMAIADHKAGHDGGPKTERELAEARCGNNGGGNDGEILFQTRDGFVCRKNVANEDHRRDVDPN
jgi:hypothetical protein